nr:MFS transporter [Sulfuracidifex metallicus]
MGIQQKSDFKWMYTALPFNASTGPLSTLITLEILRLHGNAINVGLAISLGNAILIPASIIWGLMADRYSRKYLILTSFAGTGASLLAIVFLNTIPLVSADYALSVFFSTAASTPMNLLIMATAEKKKWASAFSRLSMVSSIGMLLGLIISSVAVNFVPLILVIQIMGLLSIISLILGLKLIPRSPIRVERVAMVHHRESFSTRIRMLPLFFLHLPQLAHFKMFSIRRLRRRPVNYIPMLYLGIVAFYFSSGLFNTVYPAGLYTLGVSSSIVLAVISLGMVAQTLTFYFAGKAIEERGEKLVASFSLLVRGLSYVIMGISTLATTGAMVVINSLFYPLAAGFAYSLYYSSSTTMIFKVVGERRQGTGLGVYSTVVGIALLLGSLTSGYVSHFLGYAVDFSIAGGILLMDALLFSKLEEG